MNWKTVGYTDIEGIPTKSVGLLFHPDFIRGTSLGRKIRKYTFFSYEANEALHLSEEERTIVLDCLKKIEMELRHAIDKHSKGLIATNIELLLDYCMRFYERQFVTREDLNLDALARFERLLDDYLSEGVAAREGLPSVRYFADKICLSPNYFGDLVKKETGKSAQEYIQLKMIDAAKESLLDPDKTIGQNWDAIIRSISSASSDGMPAARRISIGRGDKGRHARPAATCRSGRPKASCPYGS